MHSDNKEPIEKPAYLAVTQERIMEDLQKSGCPVCNYMEDAVFGFLAKWQYALTYDEKAQRNHALELGFCPVHTWHLAAVATSRGLSRGYPRLLELIADELLKLIDASVVLRDDIAALIQSSENCRVCQLLQETEKTYINRLATCLECTEGSDLYSRSHGVCLHHLSLLISPVHSAEVVRFLLEEKAKRLRETANHMQNYVLKHEALDRHLISRDEQRAYLRALVHIAGARNICALHIRPVD